MEPNFLFFTNAALLGVGLAMDAFSVSLANGLNDPDMKRWERLRIAGTFAAFQFLMPMLGWLCVHTAVEAFSGFQRLIPWIALILLGLIGGKMVWEGLHPDKEERQDTQRLTHGVLLMQGVATSIDALSVGFTISDYSYALALITSLIIALITLALCPLGVAIGRKAGTVLSSKASILGGAILIMIGLEIFIKAFI
ncbi:MAG: manganese efflux pump [Clostridia bacterium]|nr:manganese efflux pump [Clostridia bacterium]